MIRFLNDFLKLLGFRRSQWHWGIVYDSVSKQPLDPAIVRLIDVKSGHAVQTSTTDIEGRYGFLAYPGQFKIFAKKTNYNFPSKIIREETDGIYNNLYRGEFFELSGETGVISFNIPMDPVNLDWNQQAKQKIVKSHPVFENLLLKLVSLLFWLILILALVQAWFFPSKFIYGVLVFYTIVFLLAGFLPRPKPWGRVLNKKTKEPIEGAHLELANPDFPGVIMSRARSLKDGKFFIRLPKGNYLLKITSENKQGQQIMLKALRVKIGGSGVLSEDFKV